MAIVNSYTRRMPTPEKTSTEAIVEAARDLLETEGLAGLTMQAVADRVGVRAPSLYKRVAGRDELIRLVAEATLDELTERLERGVTAEELLNEFRTFSKQRPAAFQLCMAPGPGTPRPRESAWVKSGDAIVRAARDLVGDERALEAGRTLTAWATGFLTMELGDRFKRGGDVEAAWRFGVAAMIAGLEAS